MKSLTFLLLPAAIWAAQPRYARLGTFAGPVEVQLTAADSWKPAEHNLPLPESAWIRTGAAARAEIELDDGGVWRLGPDSQGEISDYTLLSTGQRVTLLSLDHGLAFFTGQARGIDSLLLAAPGAHVTLAGLAHVRLEAHEGWSQVWVQGGAIRFSCPAAELDLVHGQTARVEPANPSRFFLDRDNPATDLDRWSAARDEALANPVSAFHVMERSGVADLDVAGAWVATDAFGTVWKPKVADDWLPFQNGRWRWYCELGYTWVSDDPWGWLPYHYGRWAHTADLGWFWTPNVSQVFKPGEVYWLAGAGLAGWGPLAPGEQWTGGAHEIPLEFLNRYTTYASFQPGTSVIDPFGFTGRPQDPLRTAAFLTALPSPPFQASRLDATRPLVQAGSTRVAPILPGVTYQSEELPVHTYQPTAVVLNPPPPPPVVIVENPPAPPPEVVPELVPYPVAVYSGIVMGNPPVGTPAPASKSAVPPPGAKITPPPARRPIPPTEPGGRSKRWQERVEYDLAQQAVNHAANPALAIQDLDTWKRRYPHSDFENERNYYYVQAYSRVAPSQPIKLLGHAAPLVEQDPQTLFDDTEIGRAQTLNALYLATMAAQNLSAANPLEVETGRRAAQNLLQYLPQFFADSHRPANVTPELWTKARADMEAAARRTLAAARRHR